ncbi:MAG: glycosyltransferase family 4 protein [Planctomycetes bacterium]|nr:glycosyltransferase family 4 protein [Planctomycetota bacterium]
MSPPRLALVFYNPTPPGGSELVMAWTIQALRDRARLTVITSGEIDPGRWNPLFGTSLAPRDFDIIRLPIPPFLGRNLRTFMLARHLYMRACRRLAPRFDACFSLQAEMDFGRRALQYVYWPGHRRDVKTLHPRTALGRAYVWFHEEVLGFPGRRLRCALSGFSLEGIRRNATLACSEYTAGMMREFYGIDARVVYPPVPPAGGPRLEWGDREDRFLFLGRLDEDKRPHEAIDILSRVRRRGFPVRLHLVGRPGARGYYRRLRRAVEENGEWVREEGALPRRALEEMRARCRYAINCCPTEGFGIAVAEAVQAGCVTFVLDAGAQREIVGDGRMKYSSPDEGAERIAAVLASRGLQEDLRRLSASWASRFTAERYVGEIRGIVAEFLERRG